MGIDNPFVKCPKCGEKTFTLNKTLCRNCGHFEDDDELVWHSAAGLWIQSDLGKCGHTGKVVNQRDVCIHATCSACFTMFPAVEGSD